MHVLTVPISDPAEHSMRASCLVICNSVKTVSDPCQLWQVCMSHAVMCAIMRGNLTVHLSMQSYGRCGISRSNHAVHFSRKAVCCKIVLQSVLQSCTFTWCALFMHSYDVIIWCDCLLQAYAIQCYVYTSHSFAEQSRAHVVQPGKKLMAAVLT